MTSEKHSSIDVDDVPLRDPWAWRIRTVLGKTTAMLVACVAASSAARGLERWLGADQQLVFWAVFAPLVYSMTRVFRGADESDDPRPWWQMTARSTASLMLGGIPALWVVLGTIAVRVPLPELIAALIVLALCALYLNSAVRLMRRRR